MDTSNEQQLNSLLDKYNECHELLQQEYIAKRIDAKTQWHLKVQLARILQMIPREKFETIRKELYDVLQIINM